MNRPAAGHLHPVNVPVSLLRPIMSTLNVRVHPVVLFNIVDAYERRNESQDRVIGTLLGTQDKSGAVEVTNSFVVQHREANGEVAIDIDVAKELLELYRRVNASESIIGWFSTGQTDVNEYSVSRTTSRGFPAFNFR